MSSGVRKRLLSLGRMAAPRLRHGLFRLFRLLGLTWAPPPLYLVVETTARCNLRCPMCPREAMEVSSLKAKIDLTTFGRILDKVGRVMHVNFLGVGEPFVEPDFVDILREAARRAVWIAVTTNGTLLTRTVLERLPPNMTVCVSLETTDPADYQRIRGVPFDKFLERVRDVKALRPDIALQLNTVLLGNELPKALDLVRFAADVRADQLKWMHICPHTLDQSRDHASNFESFAPTMREARELARAVGIRMLIPPRNPKWVECIDPWFKLVVRADGTAAACSLMYHYHYATDEGDEWYGDKRKAVPLKRLRLGNLLEQPFAEVWNGTAMREVRRALLKAPPQGVTSGEDYARWRDSVDSTTVEGYCDICLHRWSAGGLASVYETES